MRVSDQLLVVGAIKSCRMVWSSSTNELIGWFVGWLVENTRDEIDCLKESHKGEESIMIYLVFIYNIQHQKEKNYHVNLKKIVNYYMTKYSQNICNDIISSWITRTSKRCNKDATSTSSPRLHLKVMVLLLTPWAMWLYTWATLSFSGSARGAKIIVLRGLTPNFQGCQNWIPY